MSFSKFFSLENKELSVLSHKQSWSGGLPPVFHLLSSQPPAAGLCKTDGR